LDDEDKEGETPRIEDGPLTLTRSVLFRSDGVPDLDSGRSTSEGAGRVGSELFCVISSRKARTSAASPGLAVTGGVAAAVVESTPGAGESESRSSRNWSASCCLDLDLVLLICGRVGVDAYCGKVSLFR